MSRDTRQVIINALFSLAQENPDWSHFTIQDVAKEAGISRQAIYQKHYASVEDIINDIHVQIATEARNKLFSSPPTIGVSPYQAVADELLPVLYEHRDWLRVIYNSPYLSSGWFRYLSESYREWMLPFIEKRAKELNLKEEILLQLTINQIYSLIVVWLKQPFPLHPDRFKEIFLDMLVLSPNDYLEECFRINSR